jgi:RNA polymerase sigma factor (sigma-70 family)
MATAHSNTVLHHIRQLVAAEQTDQRRDGSLLERFVQNGDETAFATLVRRHGPLVLGVCRRVLHNGHDAEDAFQATFLVLARKARSIIKRESVGSWLYQVAYRMALRARTRVARRQLHERQAAPQRVADPLDEVTGRELLLVLDAELHRLPERHRAPLVLCYLQGRTRDQAARELGWSLRALKHRLEQARERLRAVLARRGLALPAALLATGLGEPMAQAAVPARLVGATIQVALPAASRGSAATGAVSALAQEALRAMTVAKLKVATGLLLAVGTVFLCAIACIRQAPAPAGGRPTAAKATLQAQAAKPRQPAGPAETAKVTVAGRVLDSAGKALAKARAALIGLPKGTIRRSLMLLDEKILGAARPGADGRFRLAIPHKALTPYARVYLLAGAAGHGLVWQEIKLAAPRAETVVRLPAEKVIRGRLRDLQGLPVAGVVVHVSWLGSGGTRNVGETRLGALPKGSAPLWPAPATTDKQGKFFLRGLNPELHGYVHVESNRFAPHYAQIKPSAGKKVQEVTMVLAPAQIIEGVVTAADTGKPLPRALVSVNSDQNPDAPEAMGPGVSGRADAQGRFRLNPPRGKMFTVRARLAEGEPYLRTRQSFKWPKGAVRHQVNLTLTRALLIRGKVTEAGSDKPVAGAIVRDTKGLWTNPTVSTKADGTFQIAVPPGRGHLLIKGPGNDYIPIEMTWSELEGGKPRGRRFYPDALVPFDLKPGAAAKEVAVRLRRGVTIRGRLLGPGGRAPREALLLCWNQVPNHAPIWFAAAVHVPDGRFELHGCDPDKTYTVHFLDAENERGATVQLSAKKAGGKPVTVRLEACGSAEVRFVDKKRKPLSDFRPIFYIVARPGSNDSRKGPSADSDFVANVDHLHYRGGRSPVDAQGLCKFPALIPGATYRILDNTFQSVKDFTVKPGAKLKLPEIVIANPR